MHPTDDALGPALIARARWAISRELGLTADDPPGHPAFAERGACFVTLTSDGRLRGCIGSLQPQRPLGEDVDHNAVAAAMNDHRFEPMTASEWPSVKVEVSVLSRPEFMDFKSEQQVLEQLQPGRDGVIFFEGCRRATFLPQVWAQLPEPREFLGHLKQKAGLPAGHWSNNVMIATYQVEKFVEDEHTV